MNWIVFHIVSGHAFFSGIVLLVTAALVSVSSRRLYSRIANLAFTIGVIAIAISSTPMSIWLLIVGGILTVLWCTARFKKYLRMPVRYGVIIFAIIATCFEVPFHMMPKLEPANGRAITVIGDSVTAGVGNDQEQTWPKILAREKQLTIQDISHVGETSASALKRVQEKRVEGAIVFIEIGGNDILGSTTSAQFEKDLNNLLEHLARKNRQLVMFELPLPPFFHRYGTIQRKLAAKYNVKLIPKRIFLSVIAGDESTLDSIHLTQEGHQLMAETVGRIVAPAFTDHVDQRHQ